MTVCGTATERLSRRLAYFDDLVPSLAAAESSAAVAAVSLRGATTFFRARGALLAEGTYAEVSGNPQVIEAYMGSADAAAGAHG